MIYSVDELIVLMQPYTPHGDSNNDLSNVAATVFPMQPYTPHGDSNIHGADDVLPDLLAGCNLIPLTGTVTDRQIDDQADANGCNLIPLALCRFLRRTYKVLAKPGALRQPWLPVSAAGSGRRGCPSRGQ